MRFGYCLGGDFIKGDLEVLNAVAEAGFDYVELPMSSLAALPPDELEQRKKDLAILPCRACNIFFPADITLVGPGMDLPGIKAYLEQVVPLCTSLGVETIVFGNGGARKVLDGMTREGVQFNLRTIFELMEEYVGKAGITVVAEPLNTRESNIINSYAEAVELTKGLTHVVAMVDSYHVAMERQNYDDVIQFPDRLAHLHTAYPVGRFVPGPEDEMALYTGFVNAVKKVGYTGKLSVEGGLRRNGCVKEEVTSALKFLKGLF